MKEIKFDQYAGQEIAKGLNIPIKNFKNYFLELGVMIDTKTQRIFNTEGNYPQHTKWRPIPIEKYRFASGRFAIRRGSDGTPKPIYKTGDGKWRKWRGNGVRRWGTNSKALQASGMFRKSFGTLSLTNRHMIYGTNYSISKDIAKKNGDRPILMITQYDVTQYRKRLIDFFKAGIKF